MGTNLCLFLISVPQCNILDTRLSGFVQYLDVNKVSNEGHEDHLVSVPALPGVHFNPPLQLPSLATVTHEDLKEGAKKTHLTI